MMIQMTLLLLTQDLEGNYMMMIKLKQDLKEESKRRVIVMLWTFHLKSHDRPNKKRKLKRSWNGKKILSLNFYMKPTYSNRKTNIQTKRLNRFNSSNAKIVLNRWKNTHVMFVILERGINVLTAALTFTLKMESKYVSSPIAFENCSKSKKNQFSWSIDRHSKESICMIIPSHR